MKHIHPLIDFYVRSGDELKLLDLKDPLECNGVTEYEANEIVDNEVEIHNTSEDAHPYQENKWKTEVINTITPTIAGIVEQNIEDKLEKEELVPGVRKGITPPVLSLGDRVLRGVETTFTASAHSDFGPIDYFIMTVPELNIYNQVFRVTDDTDRATLSFTVPADFPLD